MKILSPSSWTGMTALLIVVVLALVGAFGGAVHKMLATVAWSLVALVAVMAIVNNHKSN